MKQQARFTLDRRRGTKGARLWSIHLVRSLLIGSIVIACSVWGWMVVRQGPSAASLDQTAVVEEDDHPIAQAVGQREVDTADGDVQTASSSDSPDDDDDDNDRAKLEEEYVLDSDEDDQVSPSRDDKVFGVDWRDDDLADIDDQEPGSRHDFLRVARNQRSRRRLVARMGQLAFELQSVQGANDILQQLSSVSTQVEEGAARDEQEPDVVYRELREARFAIKDLEKRLQDLRGND